LSQSAIEELLENFFLRELDERSSYKELLPIFEKPLLKATKSKFHSQLQMAKKLDINRNTLRKKLHENGLDG
jgi:DNA-binding protein Fis